MRAENVLVLVVGFGRAKEEEEGKSVRAVRRRERSGRILIWWLWC